MTENKHDQDLARLSAAERAALEESIDGEDEDLDEEEDDHEDEETPSAEPQKAGKASKESADEAAAVRQPVEAPVGVEYEFTLDQAELDKKVAKRDELEDALSALDENYDLSDEERRAAARKINKQISKLSEEIVEIKAEARFAEKYNKGVTAARQKYIQDRFDADVAHFKEQGNELFFDNPIIFAAFNQSYQALIGDSKNSGKSNLWFLESAKKTTVKYMQDLGFQLPGGKRDPESKQETKTNDDADAKGSGKPADGKKRPKAPNLKDIPPTLSGKPSAAGNDDKGEFSHLDDMTGLDLEAAVARMTPEQQRKWAMA